MNDPVFMIDTALQGLGLIYHTEDALAEHLKTGKLKLVLENYAPKSDGYFLYYPSRSQVLPKLRAFIDYLKSV